MKHIDVRYHKICQDMSVGHRCKSDQFGEDQHEEESSGYDAKTIPVKKFRASLNSIKAL